MGKTKKKQKGKPAALITGQSTMIAAMIEDAEMQLAVAETQGKIIDKMAYSFNGKGSAIVEGLTYWGMLACAQGAKKNNWTPEWTKPEFQKLEGTQMLCVIGCKNPRTKLIEWGTCSFDPRLRFDERKALTNAKRYALDKHLAVVQKIAFLQYLKKHNPANVMQITDGATPGRATKFVVSESGSVTEKELPEAKAKRKVSL